MMKKSRNLIVCFTTVLLVLGITTPASLAYDLTSPKEEAIYVVLKPYGDVGSIYAVNSFETGKPGLITDYGDYSSLRNMTTKDPVHYADKTVTVNVPGGKFYYQGNPVSREIPWKIAISYTLDKQPIDAGTLLGKSGSLELTIEVKKNDKVRPEFFKNYSLQMALSLDTEKCSNIEAPGAMMANAGTSKSITFIHLSNTEKKYTVKADVRDFEMAPIQFNGVNLSIDLNLGDVENMTGNLSKLSGGIGRLDDGAQKLKKGSSEWKSGMENLAGRTKDLPPSSEQVYAAINQAAGGLAELLKNSEELKNLANTLLASTDPQVLALANGYLTQSTALEQLSAGLNSLAGRYSQFHSGISQVTDGINTLAGSYPEIDNGLGELSAAIHEMNLSTSSLDSDVHSIIQKMLSQSANKDYKPVSFLSKKNTHIQAVQFIMRTDALARPEEKQPPAAKEQTLTFWQRLVRLFQSVS